jgi:LmbE family N-acetylglucosaminyl deacetylase
MIIAPHPDDEVLAAGGVILKALNSSKPLDIRVIIATNGDASYTTSLLHGSHLPLKQNFRRQAVMRQQESLNALASLGLEGSHVHFWGFPDRGLSSLWKDHWDEQHPYRSATTGYDSSVQAVNSPIVKYTKASVEILFGYELLEFCPTMLIMPHPHDRHPDHSALAGFTLSAVKHFIQACQPPPVLYAYWTWQKEKPWFTGTRSLDLAQVLVEHDSAQVVDRNIALEPRHREQKARALQYYPSQKIPAGKIFCAATKNAYETFTLLLPISSGENSTDA